MLNFQSYEELNNFILNNGGRGGTNPATPSATMPAPMPTSRPEGSVAAVSPSQDSNKAAGTYSMTNIQVAGVDEADTVKTDGTYLYTIVNGTTVYILNADQTTHKMPKFSQRLLMRMVIFQEFI